MTNMTPVKQLRMMRQSILVSFSFMKRVAIMQTKTGVVCDMIDRSATEMYCTHSTLVDIVAPLIADLRTEDIFVPTIN